MMKMRTIRVVGLVLLALQFIDATKKLKKNTIDETTENNAAGDDVVDATVQKIQEPCLFDDDKLMLRRTAYAQSKDGAITTSNGGIWQISETDFESTKTQTTSALLNEVNSAYGVDWANAEYANLGQPLYSGLAARLLMENNLNSVSDGCTEQKDDWNAVFNPSGTDETYNEACSEDEQACSAPKVDLLFVLDASGSIGADNFLKTKNFTGEVSTDFTVGRYASHIGVIEFATSADVVFGLDEYSTNQQVLAAIRDISYTTGGTNTAEALLLMNQTLFDQGRHGEGVPAIGLVVTDGRSNDKQATLAAANALHEQGNITIFAIGVGTEANLDIDELNAIGTDPDCRHVFLMNDFEAVLNSVSQISQVTCKTPAPIADGELSQAELGPGDNYYISLDVTEEQGEAVLGVDVMMGDIDIYLSWNAVNPNSAIHDYSVSVETNSNFERISVPYSDGVNSVMQRRRRRAAGQPLKLYATIVGGKNGGSFSLSGAISGMRAQVGAILLIAVMTIARNY